MLHNPSIMGGQHVRKRENITTTVLAVHKMGTKSKWVDNPRGLHMGKTTASRLASRGSPKPRPTHNGDVALSVEGAYTRRKPLITVVVLSPNAGTKGNWEQIVLCNYCCLQGYILAALVVPSGYAQRILSGSTNEIAFVVPTPKHMRVCHLHSWSYMLECLPMAVVQNTKGDSAPTISRP